MWLTGVRGKLSLKEIYKLTGINFIMTNKIKLNFNTKKKLILARTTSKSKYIEIDELGRKRKK